MNEAIINMEIGNKMGHGDAWDNKKAEIVCVGILLMQDRKRDCFVQLVKMREHTKEEYVESIAQLFESLNRARFSLCTINAEFAMEAIEANFGINVEIDEIRLNLRGSLSSKDNLFKYLQKTLGISEIKDNLNGNADLVPDFYKTYLEGGDYFYLQEIMQHNINCLLKEYYILREIKTILKGAEVDKNGFILRFRENVVGAEAKEGTFPAEKEAQDVSVDKA